MEDVTKEQVRNWLLKITQEAYARGFEASAEGYNNEFPGPSIQETAGWLESREGELVAIVEEAMGGKARNGLGKEFIDEIDKAFTPYLTDPE